MTFKLTGTKFRMSDDFALTRDSAITQASPLNVRTFGAKGDGATDDTAAIQAAVATDRDVFFPAGIYKITATIVGGAGSWRGAGSGGTYGSDGDAGTSIIRCIGSNGGAKFVKPPTVMQGLHFDGVDAAGDGLALGQQYTFTGFQRWRDIVVRRFNIGIECYNFYQVKWDSVTVQSCNRGIRIAPLNDNGENGGDNGYFTSTLWQNVHVANCSVYGLYVDVPVGCKTWVMHNVVIENNGGSGTYQAYLSQVTLAATGLSMEGSSSKKAILLNASTLNLRNSYFLGTGGIDCNASTVRLAFDSVFMSAATDTIANVGSASKLTARGCVLQTAAATLCNQVELVDTESAGVQFTHRVRALSVGSPNVDDEGPSELGTVLSFTKSVTATIAAGASAVLVSNRYHYGLWPANGFAALDAYRPGLRLEVTPADTGSPHYFRVIAFNTTDAEITLSAATLKVMFLKATSDIAA